MPNGEPGMVIFRSFAGVCATEAGAAAGAEDDGAGFVCDIRMLADIRKNMTMLFRDFINSCLLWHGGLCFCRPYCCKDFFQVPGELAGTQISDQAADPLEFGMAHHAQ